MVLMPSCITVSSHNSHKMIGCRIGSLSDSYIAFFISTLSFYAENADRYNLLAVHDRHNRFDIAVSKIKPRPA